MPWIQGLVVPVLLFFGTFTIGAIPLYYASISPSERGLFVISNLGLGMLLGAAFMLVIPEGLEKVNVNCVGIDLLIGFILTYLLESLAKHMKNIQDQLRQFLGSGIVVALVIHGFADGLVLGTAAGQVRTLLLLLLAVTVHRIPVALSLVSVLISQEWLARNEVAKQLLIFSLSSPCGYILAAVAGSVGFLKNLGGHLLLVSGGSLLYAGFSLRSSNTKPSSRQVTRPSPSPDAGREASDGFIVLEPSETEPEHIKSEPFLVAAGTLIPVLTSFFGED